MLDGFIAGFYAGRDYVEEKAKKVFMNTFCDKFFYNLRNNK